MPDPATPVLVLGATGTIGPHVVSALNSRSVPVRILTRDGARAKALLPKGTDIRVGDPGDDDALTEAAQGVESMFLLSSHSHRMAELQLRIIRSLRRSGVRIVKLSGTSSGITPNGPHALRQHWEVEQVLTTSGQPFVILRANAFMQTLIDQQLIPTALTTGTVSNPIGTAGISFVDARDVGAAAAQVLTLHDWDGQTMVLTGERAVTYREIADIIGERTGRQVATKEIAPDDVRRALEERGMAAWEAEHFEEMYQLFRDGGSQFVTGDLARVLGRPPVTVEEHLAVHPALAPVDAHRTATG